MQAAVDELQTLIRQAHPEAQFRVSRDLEGSDAVHMIAVLDVDDTDLAVDQFIDRMMQLQIDERLPLFVIPARTPERELEHRSSNPDPGRVAALNAHSFKDWALGSRPRTRRIATQLPRADT